MTNDERDALIEKAAEALAKAEGIRSWSVMSRTDQKRYGDYAAAVLAVFKQAHTPEVETWLPIPGYEGFYEVSDLGRVRSLDRTIKWQRGDRRLKGKVLAGIPDKWGRLRVHLRNGALKEQVYVHRLVLLAFVGPCPDGMEACHHPDPTPVNNRLENLRWDTKTENQFDRQRQGVDHERNKTHCPMGHPLVAPNLVAWSARQGWRLCLACRRARSVSRRKGVPFTQELTDEKFTKIMEEAA